MKGQGNRLASTLTNGITLQQGRYRVEQVLGEGGFGITYQATDMRLGRAVAIKELFILGSTREGGNVHPPLTYSPQAWSKAIQNFLLEARILAGLDHPGIVAVYDQFEENNTAYMVMKFIVGTTLSRLMVMQGGTLAEDEAREYTMQVGQALVVVHDHNLLHRDIKPSNIILQPNGQTVLIDFGAAREFALDRSVAVTAIASSGFSPPEQFYAKGRKGPYTDVFSLAATCYYLITGVAPTHELDEPPQTALLPALNHALAFNPQDRPQTVTDFLAELSGQKPAPPVSAVSSVIQATGGDTLSDSYLQGAYATLMPPPDPAAPSPVVPRASAPPTVNSAPLSVTAPPYQPPPNTATTIVSTELRASDAPVLPPPISRQSSPLLMIIGGIAALLLLAILAFLLLGHNGPNSNDTLVALQATQTSVAGQIVPTFNRATPTTPLSTPYPSNTPLLVADQPTPTSLIAMSAALPPATTDTTLPAEGSSQPGGMPAQPTSTLIPPTATPRPPTATPRPPTSTPRPSPTSTLRPPTRTPIPPTATPLPPPPNPTTNPSTALGPGWSQLGPADFTTYFCDRVQPGTVARLTKLPRNATALDWACYTADTQKVGGISMADACRLKYGADVGANFADPNDANSWFCSRGGVKFAAAPEQEYCASRYLYGEAKLENRSDVQPVFRWACFAPTQLGPINTAAACTNQYGLGALGYWLTLDDPRWSCWRRQ